MQAHNSSVECKYGPKPHVNSKCKIHMLGRSKWLIIDSWHTIIINTNNVLTKYYDKVTFSIIIFNLDIQTITQLEVTTEQML